MHASNDIQESTWTPETSSTDRYLTLPHLHLLPLLLCLPALVLYTPLPRYFFYVDQSEIGEDGQQVTRGVFDAQMNCGPFTSNKTLNAMEGKRRASCRRSDRWPPSSSTACLPDLPDLLVPCCTWVSLTLLYLNSTPGSWSNSDPTKSWREGKAAAPKKENQKRKLWGSPRPNINSHFSISYLHHFNHLFKTF